VETVDTSYQTVYRESEEYELIVPEEWE
jgi:hypothetical protein